jgi:hypothetical protein
MTLTPSTVLVFATRNRRRRSGALQESILRVPVGDGLAEAAWLK